MTALDSLSDRDLVMRFESLGGSGHGCEFGLLQRHCGADPLGLLRWADLSLDLLVKALERRFEGVGLAANTIVFRPEHSDEWWTKDKRFGMAMRSFVKAADISLERMTLRVCRRLQFLRGKIVEGLQSGGKIFVYRNVFRDLTDVELARLHAAVRCYGDSTLFYVRYADAEHPAGTVEAAAPGLLIGYIEHFAFSPDDKPIKPANDAWLALCGRAYRIHQQLPAETCGEGSAEPQKVQVSLHTHGVARCIVLIGNCQMQAMANLYRRFVAGRTGDVLKHIVSYQDLTSEGKAAIEQADVVVEQLFDLRQQVDTAGVGANTPRLYIPMVTGAFLWPFAGQPHPLNTDYPFLTGGPYGGEAADSYLNKQILAGADPEEAVEIYADLDVNRRVKLDRLYELVIDRQRSRDEAAGYRIAEVIERHFRTEQIFLSPYHPNVRVAVALASQFLRQLGAAREDIDRMAHCTRVTPFPKGELPLHPSVCRHFGLGFAAPDRRYRFRNEGFFTFREYALRYMRYEWNDALEEGMSLVHAGDPEAARARLVQALERSPNSAAGQNALSHAFARTGFPDEAIAAGRRAVVIEPNAASYHANLGNLLREAKRFDEAEVALRAAISEDPTEPHYYVVLAHILRQLGRVAQGAELISRAIALDPYSPRLATEYVEFTAGLGGFESSVAALRAVIALDPGDASGHHRLAALLGQHGRFEEATDAAQQAVALEPTAARHRILLSEVLLRRGRKAEALTEAYAAAAVEPNSAHARGQLGEVLQATGDHAAAEAALRQAVELGPRDPHARHQLSVLLNQQNRFDEGIAAAREAAELEPDNPQRFGHLARLLAQQKDLSGARTAQRRAVELQPDTVSFRVILSDLFARDGLVAEAPAEAEIAVRRNPGSAHALGHLAHVTQLSGNFEVAAGMFRDAIEIAPGNQHLRLQLARLERRRADANEADASR